MLEEEDVYNVAEIVIQPPDVNDLTDEDSGDEDGPGKIDNLSKNQLLANAEVIFMRLTRYISKEIYL
jgi:hypothetical protein